MSVDLLDVLIGLIFGYILGNVFGRLFKRVKTMEKISNSLYKINYTDGDTEIASCEVGDENA